MTRNKNQDEVYDEGRTSSIEVAELPDSDLDSVNGGWCGGSDWSPGHPANGAVGWLSC